MNHLYRLLLLFVLATPACAAWQKAKPFVQTVDDIARSMCAVFYGQQNGVSAEQAARLYCATRDAWAPWLDPALAGTQAGGVAAGAAPQPEPSPEPPVEPPSEPAGEPAKGDGGGTPSPAETAPAGQPEATTEAGG